MSKQFDAKNLPKRTRGLFQLVKESDKPVQIVLNGEVVCLAVSLEHYSAVEPRASRIAEIPASALRSRPEFFLTRAQLDHHVIVQRNDERIALVPSPDLTNPITRDAVRISRRPPDVALVIRAILAKVTDLPSHIKAQGDRAVERFNDLQSSIAVLRRELRLQPGNGASALRPGARSTALIPPVQTVLKEPLPNTPVPAAKAATTTAPHLAPSRNAKS